MVRPAAGGMLRHVQVLTERLAEAGVSVGVCAPQAVLEQLQAGQFGRGSLAKYPVGWERSIWRAPWRVWRIQADIVAAVRQFAPDLVHCHGLEGVLVGGPVCHRLEMPYCVTLHNQLPGMAGGGGLQQRLRRWVGQQLQRHVAAADGVILVSPEMALAWPGARVRVIVNGVDVNTDPPGQAEPAMALGQALRVAVLSRLAPEKGLDLLIQALRDWDQAARPITVRVAGDGPLQSLLQRKAQEAGVQDKIGFLGRLGRQEVQQLLDWCELLLLPSRTEGLPLAVLEAMAAKRPVAASRVGGIPWVVQPGVTGILFEPYSVVAVRRALEQAWSIRQDLAQMGRQGYKRVVEQFSLDAMVQQTLSFYQEILEGDSLEGGSTGAGRGLAG